MPRPPLPGSPIPARFLPVLICLVALALLFGARSLVAGTTDEAAPTTTTPGGTVTETPTAPADAPATGEPEGNGEPEWTLWKILQLGGWMMYILYALSVVTIALIAFHFLSLTPGNIVPAPFVAKVRDMLEKKRFSEAAMYCAQHKSVVSAVVSAGLENSSQKRVFVIEAMGSEGSRQASRLWQQISYLADISVIAPMCGLLGTVTGMLWTFRSLQSGGGVGVGQVNPTQLAGGIFQAMITTAAGLIIGILAMAFYSVFRGMVQRLIVTLEETGDRFADLISRGE
ncbi:MAG: MotA/TolQ/ExbB proton channel family protein [Verrucomicrobia bacterium]|nr:MotA/TolQ/ExbB proton channel family protein [Verrucomicrobiota bacterium]